MAQVYEFRTAYPPSVNRMWRNGGGKTYMPAEIKAYKQTVAIDARNAGVATIEGAIAVTVDVYRPAKRGDLDNRLKVILDSLNGVAYDDDEQIVEIVARRHEEPKGKRGTGRRKGYVVVTIREAA